MVIFPSYVSLPEGKMDGWNKLEWKIRCTWMIYDDLGWVLPLYDTSIYDVILSSHGKYMLKSCCHLDHSKYVLFSLAAEPSRPLLLGCIVRLGSLEHGFVKALQGKGRETYLSYCRFHCLQFLARELSTFRRSTMHRCVPPADIQRL